MVFGVAFVKAPPPPPPAVPLPHEWGRICGVRVAKADQHNFASGKHYHCIFFSGSRKNPCILKDVLPSVMMLIFLENLVRHTSLGRKGQA